MAACSDSDLNKMASASKKFAAAVGQVQADVHAAHDANLISQAVNDKIDVVCTKANNADIQLNAILRAIQDAKATSIDAPRKQQILDIMTAVSRSLDVSQIEDLAGIKNADTRNKIEAAFAGVRTAISTMQIILASSGGA